MSAGLNLATYLSSGDIHVYIAKDYTGGTSFSHRIKDTDLGAGPSFGLRIVQISYSPDGYALFVALNAGWLLCSVYGHLLASSYFHDGSISSVRTDGLLSHEYDLNEIVRCCWGSSGLSIILLGRGLRSMYSLPLARSAMAVCYNPVITIAFRPNI